MKKTPLKRKTPMKRSDKKHAVVLTTAKLHELYGRLAPAWKGVLDVSMDESMRKLAESVCGKQDDGMVVLATMDQVDAINKALGMTKSDHVFNVTVPNRTPRKRLRQVSPTSKRGRQQKRYLQLRREFLDANPLCQLCGCAAMDVHHKAGRGRFLCDTSTFMALCRCCHDSVHANPQLSRQQGWIVNPRTLTPPNQ